MRRSGSNSINMMFALLLSLSCLILSCTASAGVKLSFYGVDVDEVDKNGETAHVITADGTKWAVLLDKETNVPFFLHTGTKAISYTDPRTAAATARDESDLKTDLEKAYGVKGVQVNEEGLGFIEAKGKIWLVYRDEKSKRPFFVSSTPKSDGTAQVQWEDPRTIMESGNGRKVVELKEKKAKKQGSITSLAVVTIPVLLFIAGLAGRIYYLHNNHPELLFPTKERRVRRSSSKFKPQKTRGKMSQDGKGGRSANS